MAETWHEMVWEHAGDALALLDSQGRLRACNPAWERLANRHPDLAEFSDAVFPPLPDEATPQVESSLAELGGVLYLLRQQPMPDGGLMLSAQDVGEVFRAGAVLPMSDPSAAETSALASVVGGHMRVSGSYFGDRPVAELGEELYESLVDTYNRIFDRKIDDVAFRQDQAATREELRELSRTLGFIRARASDVVDLHRRVLEGKLRGLAPQKAAICISEGRLLLVEILGLLTNYYRIYYLGAPAASSSNGGGL